MNNRAKRRKTTTPITDRVMYHLLCATIVAVLFSIIYCFVGIFTIGIVETMRTLIMILTIIVMMSMPVMVSISMAGRIEWLQKKEAEEQLRGLNSENKRLRSELMLRESMIFTVALPQIGTQNLSKN